jgi:hypothetical protein
MRSANPVSFTIGVVMAQVHMRAINLTTRPVTTNIPIKKPTVASLLPPAIASQRRRLAISSGV